MSLLSPFLVFTKIARIGYETVPRAKVSGGVCVCVVSLGICRNQTWLWKVAGNGCSLAIISLETISNNLISSALDFFIYNKDIDIAIS